MLEQSIRDNAIELERMVDLRTAELRRLSGRLMTMQDEERRRIAREIHDGLGQELAAAKMILDGILSKDTSPSMRQAAQRRPSQLVDRAIQQVRTISHLLHPPLLDEVGLGVRASLVSRGLSERSGIEISLEVEPPDLGRACEPELETAIFRIIQEALTNMFRHSGARNGLVSLTEKDGKHRGHRARRWQGNRGTGDSIPAGKRWSGHWRNAATRERTRRKFAARQCQSRDDR